MTNYDIVANSYSVFSTSLGLKFIFKNYFSEGQTFSGHNKKRSRLLNLCRATFPIAPISPKIPIFPKQKSS